LIVFSVIAGSTVVAAFVLGYVAHNDVGLTRLEIRHFALIASALIATLIVARPFSRS
jgi:hypothetical protein